MNLTVTFRGGSYTLEVPADSTLAALHEQLEALTSVPPSLQKLLYKGKKPNISLEETTLERAGLKDGMKVQLVGSRVDEIDGMKLAENEKRKKEEILARRKVMNLPKPRSTGSSSGAALSYRFHNLVPLAHLPRPDTALSLLQRLSSDPAIQHVMQKHKFAVGTLTELAPHEHPNLLGLNVNRGEAIKLRLRTDSYDGFRLYSDIRRVLCHELAHNVWGDHDNNFKALNSQLNKDVVDFERSQREGAHTLLGTGPIYSPSGASSPSLFAPELESEAQAYILGGSPPSGPVSDTREERRRRALEAAISRLRKEEEELEHSCGTAGPSGDAPTSNAS
ncbi:hypothetical protein ACEPAH_3783 [Sanghuangporus vaninii]